MPRGVLTFHPRSHPCPRSCCCMLRVSVSTCVGTTSQDTSFVLRPCHDTRSLRVGPVFVAVRQCVCVRVSFCFCCVQARCGTGNLERACAMSFQRSSPASSVPCVDVECARLRWGASRALVSRRRNHMPAVSPVSDHYTKLTVSRPSVI
jgi:hypothetical protein|eukprot:175603-Prymnesium_polylepis.1